MRGVAGTCGSRTHPTPKDVTTVLKTAGHTGTHALPNPTIIPRLQALSEAMDDHS